MAPNGRSCSVFLCTGRDHFRGKYAPLIGFSLQQVLRPCVYNACSFVTDCALGSGYVTRGGLDITGDASGVTNASELCIVGMSS
jgi:hypothetical protein